MRLVPVSWRLVLVTVMDHAAEPTAVPSLLRRVYRAFDARFEKLRAGYVVILTAALAKRRQFAGLFLAFCVLSCALVFVLGRDFFPSVDAGQIRMHMRLPTGTRIVQSSPALPAICRPMPWSPRWARKSR